jgi:hypothetical protein
MIATKGRIPGIYINILGETVKIDAKSLDSKSEVCGFDLYSMIPTFHHPM